MPGSENAIGAKRLILAPTPPFQTNIVYEQYNN